MTNYDYQNNCLTVTCNTCGKEAEFDGDFKHCISEAKAVGWIIMIKKRGFDVHFCSGECRGKL